MMTCNLGTISRRHSSAVVLLSYALFGAKACSGPAVRDRGTDSPTASRLASSSNHRLWE